MVGASRYPHVSRPIAIGRVTVPNRIVRTAAGTGLAPGHITDEFIRYHLARARGGVGLLILGDMRIHESTTGKVPMWNDDAIPRYKEMTAAIHDARSVVFQELSHHGSFSGADRQPWSASARPDPVTGVVPLEMSPAMINQVVDAFAAASGRCRDAGFDGIEIHAGHGFLVSQFLSPSSNHRSDRYGGSLHNRTRFLREVLTATRQAVAGDIPVGVRLSASEWLDHGLTVADTIGIVRALQEAGLTDFVDVSLGHLASYYKLIGGMHEPRRYQLDVTAQVTAEAAVPTIVAGRVDSLEIAEQIVAAGISDLVSMMRATIADPDLVVKSFDGRVDEVRPCIACNECLRGVSGQTSRIVCAVNPHVIPEQVAPGGGGPIDAEPRRVLVVGGGPAGLEAARSAAAAGHDVTVVEARGALGGATLLASHAPLRADIGRIIAWQEREIRRQGGTIHLDRAFDRSLLHEIEPELVIVATGAVPKRDGVQRAAPGWQPAGMGDDRVCTASDIHAVTPAVSSAVVLDDLGTYEAIGAAERLAAVGVQVTMVSKYDRPGADLVIVLESEPAASRLAAAGVRFEGGMLLRSFTGNEVHIEAIDGQTAGVLPANLVVLATGYEPDHGVRDALDGWPGPVVVVGDALSPGRLGDAIAHGAAAVAQLPVLAGS